MSVSKEQLRRFTAIDSRCPVCAGKCWDSENPGKTQENAHRLFGETIPNECVLGTHNVRCPFALGILK